MSKFINNNNTNYQGHINKSSLNIMIASVKSRVTIPMYFYNIIIPQLPGYYDDYPVDFDSKPVVCCPLHDEDTPSCRYYDYTESFYCFGCQRGGDVIALHRYFAEKMNGVKPSYEEGVAFIYNYFLKGQETGTFIDSKKQSLQEDKKLSTDEEIVKLNMYRFNLEKSISFDNNINSTAKKQLWEVLDTIDLLVGSNEISATDAEKYIKGKVKEIITPDSTVKTAPKIGLGNRLMV